MGLRIGNVISLIGLLLTGIPIGFLINWKLSCAAYAIVPVIVILIYFQGKELDESFLESNQKNQEAGGLAEEVLYNIKTVNTFTNHKYELNWYKNKITKANDIKIIRVQKLSIIVSIIYFLLYLERCVGIYYSSYLFSVGDKSKFDVQINTGDVYIILSNLYFAVQGIFDGLPNVKAVLEACSSASQFFGLKYETKNKQFSKLKKRYQCDEFISKNVDIEF